MIDARRKSDGGHDNIKINMNRQKKKKRKQSNYLGYVGKPQASNQQLHAVYVEEVLVIWKLDADELDEEM